MLLSQNRKLDDLLIEWLVEKPLASAEQLHQRSHSAQHRYSIQAIYQQLARLEQAGVIRKIRSRYVLNMNWINDFADFSEKMLRNYQQSNPIQSILPEEGQKVTWKLPSIAIAVRSMTQVVLALLEVYQEQPFCEWAPVCWFHLAGEDEQNFLDSLKRGRHAYYLCSPSNTALDKSYKQSALQTPGDIRLAACPLSKEPRYHTAVVGDYYIQCKFPRGLENELLNVAQNFEAVAHRSPGTLSALVHRREKITVSVACSRRRSKHFTNAYRRFFGFQASH